MKTTNNLAAALLAASECATTIAGAFSAMAARLADLANLDDAAAAASPDAGAAPAIATDGGEQLPLVAPVEDAPSADAPEASRSVRFRVAPNQPAPHVRTVRAAYRHVHEAHELLDLRQHRGWSQKHVAAALGVAKSQLGRAEQFGSGERTERAFEVSWDTVRRRLDSLRGDGGAP